MAGLRAGEYNEPYATLAMLNDVPTSPVEHNYAERHTEVNTYPIEELQLETQVSPRR